MNTIDVALAPRIFGQYIVSAKGAKFNLSLGQRPRIWKHANASAKGASHDGRSVQHGESRLQRLCIIDRSISEALPQAGNEMRPWRKQITYVALTTQGQTSP